MATEIIAICNKKGGVAKTTTAHALGAGLSIKGYKTLLIDLDSQCNLSQAAGADLTRAGAGEILRGEAAAADTVQGITDTLDIIPGGASLARADIDITETGKEYRLKEKLADLLPGYSYVVADTPPALGILTINALTAAGHLIIPAQADYFSLQALEDLQSVLGVVRKYTNHNLHTMGILFTRHNPRTVFTRDLDEVITDTAAKLQTGVFSARIREAVAIKEAQASHEDIFTYAPKSKVTADYRQFVEEVLEALKK
jgi:chromosome partitioning protein